MLKAIKNYYKSNPYRFAISFACFVYAITMSVYFIFGGDKINTLAQNLFIFIILAISLFEDFKRK